MEELDKTRKNTHAYLKYSGLAFQMAFMIGIGFYLGSYLDKLCGFEKPILTMLLILLFFTGFMYKLYISLTKDK